MCIYFGSVDALKNITSIHTHVTHNEFSNIIMPLFLFSVLFDSAQAGLLGGLVLFFLNYLPATYVLLPQFYSELEL